MGTLDIEQASRVCGLSPREVRLLIEGGELPASRPSGRWLIEERHLSLAEPEPAPSTATAVAEPPRPGRPIGADPGRPRPRLAPVPDAGGDRELRDERDTLRHELDVVRDELAALRGEHDELRADRDVLRAERDDLGLRLRDQVSSLQRSLEDSMAELDDSRARVAELEAKRFAGAVKEAGTPGPRAALTPLFRDTTRPDERAT